MSPSRAGASGVRPAGIVGLLVASCWTARAYWHPSLCNGAEDPLCAAPWVHEDPPVLRWALHPDKCLTVRAGGVGLELRDCTRDPENQHLSLAPASGGLTQLRLQSQPDKCISVVDTQRWWKPLRRLSLELQNCTEGQPGQQFELPAQQQGNIRWAGNRALTLSVEGSKVEEGTQILLLSCDSSESQQFMTPRALGGSAFVGANLGGWLVLEEWMWPAEMEYQHVRDEYSLVAKYGGPEHPRAREVMNQHWDSFLQPSHLDQLARFGVTHVRIPLGYWLLDSVYNVSDGFMSGGETYLARALGWLKTRRMRAVLDLHAVPGGQAMNDGFTGRRRPEAEFFLREDNHERGKKAVEALADLILSYEANSSTSGVVMGIELLNEPNHRFWTATSTSYGIKEFYAEMVPRVRRKLPAEKYMVMLSFMDSPHTGTSEWLAAMRAQDPVSFAGVVYDAHLYHLFGDNTDPWSTEMDLCKTCCRDTHILEPMWSLNVPAVVGEYGMSTGFAGWEAPGFERLNLANYLSLWNTTRALVGSFTWNFRILSDPEMPEMYKEWSLLGMVNSHYLDRDTVYRSDLTSLCPTLGDRVELECPKYTNETVMWNTPCEWQPRPPATSAAPRATTSATAPGAAAGGADRRLVGDRVDDGDEELLSGALGRRGGAWRTLAFAALCLALAPRDVAPRR